MRREHPFGATAYRPTCSGLRGLSHLGTVERDVGARMTPSGSALEVNEPVWHPRIAETTRQRVKPLVVKIDNRSREKPASYSPASAVAGPIKHIAEADNPAARELIVTTDLSATSET